MVLPLPGPRRYHLLSPMFTTQPTAHSRGDSTAEHRRRGKSTCPCQAKTVHEERHHHLAAVRNTRLLTRDLQTKTTVPILVTPQTRSNKILPAFESVQQPLEVRDRRRVGAGAMLEQLPLNARSGIGYKICVPNPEKLNIPVTQNKNRQPNIAHGPQTRIGLEPELGSSLA